MSGITRKSYGLKVKGRQEPSVLVRIRIREQLNARSSKEQSRASENTESQPGVNRDFSLSIRCLGGAREGRHSSKLELPNSRKETMGVQVGVGMTVFLPLRHNYSRWL